MTGPQLSITPNDKVPFRVIRETESFVIVSKPAGVPTQPGIGHDRDTLLNGLFARWGTTLQNLGRARDFGLIHRLDRPTSGLVVVALTRDAHDALRGQFETRMVHKCYLALVHGTPRPPVGTERTPIREVREHSRKVAKLGVHRFAKPAVTRYKVVASGNSVCLVDCRIETGRLHQVRVHMLARGCPVVGDRVYGRNSAIDKALAAVQRNALFLHAAELDFYDPDTGKRVQGRDPLPESLFRFLAEVRVTCPPKYAPKRKPPR